MNLDDLLITRRQMLATSLLAASLADYQPKFFSSKDFEALESFTEILIPSDDTPGAKEARCAHYIDFVLDASTEMPQVQAAWRDAMKDLQDLGFHQADAAGRLRIVSEMSRDETTAYRLIRQQTVFAFFTSRQGTIDTLDYKGNSYNLSFPACNHPEHHTL